MKTKLERYRKTLTELAARLNRQLADDQGEVMRRDEPYLADNPASESDEALDSGTLEVESGVMASEERMLADVYAALARIEDGTFGRCQKCGAAITHERLEAIPYAHYCIQCAVVEQPIAG